VDAGACEDVTPLPYDPIELAFISPDDPLPARTLTVANEPEADDDPGIEDGEEGEVVGMDLDAHAHTEDRDVSKYDPHVMELTDVLARLAESLRRHGEVGLQPSPSMTRLEATLRAYCTGYLAGRRTHAKPPAVEVSE